MIVKKDGGDLLIGGIGTFSLERTLNCGQCFSFSPTEKGGFCGVVREKVCHVRQEGELLRFFDTDEKTAQLWISYFDLDTDPTELHNAINDPQYQERISYLRNLLIKELTGREEGYTDGEKLIAGQPERAILQSVFGNI